MRKQGQIGPKVTGLPDISNILSVPLATIIPTGQRISWQQRKPRTITVQCHYDFRYLINLHLPSIYYFAEDRSAKQCQAETGPQCKKVPHPCLYGMVTSNNNKSNLSLQYLMPSYYFISSSFWDAAVENLLETKENIWLTGILLSGSKKCSTVVLNLFSTPPFLCNCPLFQASWFKLNCKNKCI